jgi:hypothetical protein
MDSVSGASLSMPALAAWMGVATSGSGGSTSVGACALATQAAAMASDATLVAGLLGSLPTPVDPAQLAKALAGLAVLDPGTELARIASAFSAS